MDEDTEPEAYTNTDRRLQAANEDDGEDLGNFIVDGSQENEGFKSHGCHRSEHYLLSAEQKRTSLTAARYYAWRLLLRLRLRPLPQRCRKWDSSRPRLAH